MRAGFGAANHARLARVKAQWDPENVFRGNQNVRPAVMKTAIVFTRRRTHGAGWRRERAGSPALDDRGRASCPRRGRAGGGRVRRL